VLPSPSLSIVHYLTVQSKLSLDYKKIMKHIKIVQKNNVKIAINILEIFLNQNILEILLYIDMVFTKYVSTHRSPTYKICIRCKGERT
jgi:hypothetical protein